MARIIIGSYAVRFAVGGYLSWVLQWLVGLSRLGHEVYFVEKASWPRACYDLPTDTMGDDCSYGVAALGSLLASVGLGDRWCFVDIHGRYVGMERDAVERLFRDADLFIDMGTHGSWLEEASAGTRVTVFVDGDPGYTQLSVLEKGVVLGEYHHYYSVGQNLANGTSTVPTLGRTWRATFDPVVVDLFPRTSAPADGAYTTVMAWESYGSIAHAGRVYGAKKLEFMKFADLPTRVGVPLELALRGRHAPTQALTDAGWRLRDAVATAPTWDRFRAYLAGSRGEFTVSKNYYVATNSGFFSERSAAYLASGRPVVMQDTGIAGHLPLGRGLFAVSTSAEAADALAEIEQRYDDHARWARELARDYLDTTRVLPRLLAEVDIEPRVGAAHS